MYTFDLESALTDHVSVLQYADDLLLYISGASVQNLSSSLTRALQILKIWLDKNGLTISVPKSSIVLFSRMRLPPTVRVHYDGSIIPVNTEAKFLGVTLDAKLTGLTHCYSTVAKCEKLLNILRCISGVWWGAHPTSLRLLYNAIVRSVLDYGSLFLEPCNALGLTKLDSIQSKALRIIAGAMKSSPINALQVECAEPPLRLRRQYLCDKYLFRALQFYNHPLYNKLNDLSYLVDNSPYWYRKSPPCLVISYRKFLSIQAPVHRSSFLPIFTTNFESLILTPTIHLNLDLDKEDRNANLKFLQILDENWHDWHHIYCDASKHSSSGHVGVGIFHHQYQIVQKVKLPPESSVFTGECFGILKALQYSILMKLNKTVIFSDSKSALQALVKFPFKNNISYPIIAECRKLLHQCHSNGSTIHLAWIPSHTNITGNEKADKLANEAVHCGDMHPYKNYCHDLTASLPKSHLRISWEENWEVTSQSKGKYYKYIQPSIPVKPWFSKMKLSKIATTTLIRMRLGHVCSPSFLAKIHIISDDMCACGSDVGDLNHIFFNCSLNDNSSFINSLLLAHVPFPTSIVCLLCSNDVNIYNIISDFIVLNHIKL
ncbi:hypothetical protein ABMA28_015012 [Loxostege sticticalis]|uniref:ribonuclease H n=1 Tax=Loxostege sticticalis TaxID=481309 RepID=A0ABD0TDY7_LOXSC